MSALDVIVALLWVWTLAAAVGVVVAQNMFHAALALLFALLGVAGIFLSLGADVVAFLHILIYVGGVMTLLVYAIMLIRRLGDPYVRQTNQGWLAGALVALLFLLSTLAVFSATAWSAQGDPRHVVLSEQWMNLARRFLGDYLLAFEGASVLLLVALVGAVVLAREEVEEENPEEVV